jgi:Flp pilus assembly pilin Flp
VHRRDERGASAVEYALIIALCVGVFIVAAYAFGDVMGAVFGEHACEQPGYECDEPSP